jgi:hypothetical protein
VEVALSERDDIPNYDRPLNWRDMKGLSDVISTARDMARQDALLFRDEGSAVLGAGIALQVVEKRCRKSTARILVHAPFQGNVGSRKACQRALDFLRTRALRDRGIPAYWYDGIMD